MTNILYLVDTGNIIGGGEISLLELLKRLDRKQFTPFVLMPYEGSLTQSLTELNIETVVFGWKKFKNPLYIFENIKRIRAFAALLKEKNIGLIHCNSTGAITLMGAFGARSVKIPFVWHVRVSNSAGLLDMVLSFLSTKILVLSCFARRRFFWLLDKKKLFVVYNGVDVEKDCMRKTTSGFRENIGCSPSDIVVGTVGRFIPLKGYSYFIKAAGEVLLKQANVTFVIVGLDYDDRNRYLLSLKELAVRLKCKDKILFLGKQENIQDVIASFDIFVFSSLADAFGRVVPEAMAKNLPVVAFGSGAIPEIIENEKSGCIVPVKDYHMMAEKILQLCNDRSLRQRVAQAARKRVEDAFSIEQHIERIEQVYKELFVA